MARVHELPTHLQVEDVLLAGLTARQLLRLMVGATLAYGLWDQAVSLPVPVRGGLAVALATAGVLLALVQPGGRSLDQWVLAALLFAVHPRRLEWRRVEVEIYPSSRQQSGWAELTPRPVWTNVETGDDPDDAFDNSATTTWWRRRA